MATSFSFSGISMGSITGTLPAGVTVAVVAQASTTGSGFFPIESFAASSMSASYWHYSVNSGSNTRAGKFYCSWDPTASVVNFTEESTSDFGDTLEFALGADIVSTNLLISGSSSALGWDYKLYRSSI